MNKPKRRIRNLEEEAAKRSARELIGKANTLAVDLAGAGKKDISVYSGVDKAPAKHATVAFRFGDEPTIYECLTVAQVQVIVSHKKNEMGTVTGSETDVHIGNLIGPHAIVQRFVNLLTAPIGAPPQRFYLGYRPKGQPELWYLFDRIVGTMIGKMIETGMATFGPDGPAKQDAEKMLFLEACSFTGYFTNKPHKATHPVTGEDVEAVSTSPEITLADMFGYSDSGCDTADNVNQQAADINAALLGKVPSPLQGILDIQKKLAEQTLKQPEPEKKGGLFGAIGSFLGLGKSASASKDAADALALGMQQFADPKVSMSCTSQSENEQTGFTKTKINEDAFWQKIASSDVPTQPLYDHKSEKIADIKQPTATQLAPKDLLEQNNSGFAGHQGYTSFIDAPKGEISISNPLDEVNQKLDKMLDAMGIVPEPGGDPNAKINKMFDYLGIAPDKAATLAMPPGIDPAMFQLQSVLQNLGITPEALQQAMADMKLEQQNQNPPFESSDY